MGAETARVIHVQPRSNIRWSCRTNLVLALSPRRSNGVSPAAVRYARSKNPHAIAIDEAQLQQLVDFGLLGDAEP